MAKKKITMADIQASHKEINRFAINRYHNDGKGHPISRFSYRGSERVIGFILLVIGIGLLIAGLFREGTGGFALVLLGGGALWIAAINLRYNLP